MARWSFSEHPASVGETYGAHLCSAWGFAGSLGLAALACLAHGLFPFLFTRTGSAMIRALHERMVTHRVRSSTSADTMPGFYSI